MHETLTINLMLGPLNLKPHEIEMKAMNMKHGIVNLQCQKNAVNELQQLGFWSYQQE